MTSWTSDNMCTSGAAASNFILMALDKAAIIPLLMHWSYHSLMPSYQYILGIIRVHFDNDFSILHVIQIR